MAAAGAGPTAGAATDRHLGQAPRGLDHQTILRLPTKLGKEVRGLVESGNDEKIKVVWVRDRTFRFYVDSQSYPAKLLDLPTIVESHKTMDRRTYYKSGEIAQVLQVFEREEDVPQETELESGLTPPTAHIKTNRYEKVYPKVGQYPRDEVARVEKMLQDIAQKQNEPLLTSVTTIEPEQEHQRSWPDRVEVVKTFDSGREVVVRTTPGDVALPEGTERKVDWQSPIPSLQQPAAPAAGPGAKPGGRQAGAKGSKGHKASAAAAAGGAAAAGAAGAAAPSVRPFAPGAVAAPNAVVTGAYVPLPTDERDVAPAVDTGANMAGAGQPR